MKDRILIHRPVPRFNRYMVECEYAIMGHLFGWHYSFNRYMVECE